MCGDQPMDPWVSPKEKPSERDSEYVRSKKGWVRKEGTASTAQGTVEERWADTCLFFWFFLSGPFLGEGVLSGTMFHAVDHGVVVD